MMNNYSVAQLQWYYWEITEVRTVSIYSNKDQYPPITDNHSKNRNAPTIINHSVTNSNADPVDPIMR